MENLFCEILEINSYNDIKKAIEKILQEDKEFYEIKINQIEPITFRFIGERFNQEFIPIKVSEISTEYKKSFVKYYNKLTNKKIDEDKLFFTFKRGSFEIDFQQIITDIIEKGVSKMSGTQVTLIILFALGAWFAKDAYNEYLEQQKTKYTDEVAIEAIKTLYKNIELQNAKNKPVCKALEILNDDEKLEYGNQKSKAAYTKQDMPKFETIEDETINYETIVGDFNIKALKDSEGKKIVTLKRGKAAKFEAVSKLDNNALLYESFDEQKPLKLKIKIGKNSKGEIVESDIYEIIK